MIRASSIDIYLGVRGCHELNLIIWEGIGSSAMRVPDWLRYSCQGQNKLCIPSVSHSIKKNRHELLVKQTERNSCVVLSGLDLYLSMRKWVPNLL